MKRHDLHSLLIAGGTLLFYMCAIPIVDAFSTWITNIFNAKSSKIQYMLAQDQEEIEEIATRVNGTGAVQAVGFQVDNDEYEVKYEED